ncbi:MAG: hypothetical protein Q3M30_08970 [Candidatus Electrothrix sp. Rat3]|nr:hypothetical protein [Candidatus Electrothrix rattekaaiensis]
MTEAADWFCLDLSFWTIYVYFVTLVVAYEGWKTSQKTLKLGIESHEFQSRPWLILNIKKYQETDKFYEITKEGDSILFNFQLRIENKGLSPAKNIKFSYSSIVNDNHRTNKKVLSDLDRIVLGKGEKFIYNISVGGSFGGDSDRLYKKYRENDEGIRFDCPLSYEGMIHPGKEYKTTINFLIKRDTFSVLGGSDFK